jgi:hypothetical protein
MDGQTLRNLQEAYYTEVHQVNEASVTDDRVRRNQRVFGSNYTPPRDWDQSANRGKGAVLNAKQKEKQRRKGLAKSAMGEAVDLYDVVLSHLLDEGYAETPEAAEAIMVNMSEEWIDSIVDEVITEGEKPFPHDKVTAQQKKHTAAGRYGNMMKMGLAKRRAKEAEKTGGSQQDAGKGWYHGK